MRTALTIGLVVVLAALAAAQPQAPAQLPPITGVDMNGTMLRIAVTAGGWTAYHDVADLAQVCPAFMATQTDENP